QQEPPVIVVAVVVLNHRVAAVPVGVKALSVPLTFGSVSFVVLDDGIVRAPRPDRNVVVLRTLAGMANDIVFDQCAVGRRNHNPIRTNVVQLIAPDDHAQAGMPFRTHPLFSPPDDPAAVDVINLVVLNS